MNDELQIDWLACPEVETVPGRWGGRPTIRGTRIEPDVIVTDAEMGATSEETRESFPHLPLGTIQAILDLAHPETFTAVYAGFGAFKNGALLKAVEDAGFDVLVTADKRLESE